MTGTTQDDAAPKGQNPNLWLRWEEKQKRARSRRIREMIVERMARRVS